MHFQRPILYCAFSNDAEYTLRLFEEEGCISSVLTELDKQGKIEYKHKDKASLDNVYDFFNDYHNRVFIFHYGGHSDSEFLHFHEHPANSEKLAILIGQQKHLKLVFLNGCANQAQVRALLEKGVPAVIATRESVGDKQAITLAEQFYKALANGKTIRESFDTAESYLKQIHSDRELVRERGCRPREESPDRPFPWGLYYENEEVLAWHIGRVEQESKLEKLSKLREASRNRHQKFTSPGGRFQHLDIQQAILAGIRDIAPNRTVRFEENVDLDGERLPLLESLSSLWGSGNPHSLVVGAGGMGKTVSLLRLWERWSVEEGEDIPVPIFIQLNEFNNNPEHNYIQNYIRRHYADLELDEVLKTPAIGQGGKPQPHILLLLDGFNEVTASSNELILEINRLRVQEDYPGIQMVLSSRVDIRSTYQWQSFHLLELQPLSDVQIQAYLRGGFPSDSRLLEVLRNPMMLSIYATQSELPKRYLEKGLLKEQVTSIGEMLFNVEAIQRIKIEEQFSLQPGALLMHRFVLEHLLPYLGWAMQQVGSYFIEEQGLLKLLCQLPIDLLQGEFFLVFKDFRKMDRETLNRKEVWELQDELIDQICCKELTMLVTDNNSYRFLHQNFRDYFAARYLQNQIRLAINHKCLPDVMRLAPLDFYVRKMLGELEGEHNNKPIYLEDQKRWSTDHFIRDNLLGTLIEECRGVFDKNQLSYTLWNILTIWVEQRGELSGTDLRKLNFQGFKFNSLINSRLGLPCCLSESILSEENLFPQGHSDWIRNAVYNPQGNHIVTVSDDETAKLWDSNTGHCLSTLQGHSSWVFCVVYNPQGDRILTGSYDRMAKVYSAQTGECLLTLKGHSDKVNSVAFSPQGNQIITGSDDRTAKVWDAQTGQCLFTIKGHSGKVNSVAFSPVKNHILTGSSDGAVRLWDSSTGQFILTLEEYSDIVSSIAFSSLGSYIITCYNQGMVKVWDAQEGQCLLAFKGHSHYINNVACGPFDDRFVTSSNDGTAKVWDLKTGHCLLNINGHIKGVSSATYNSQGDRILTCSADKTAKIWDAQTGQCLLTMQGHSGWINNASYSNQGDIILTCSDDISAKVKAWDAKTGLCLFTLKGHSDTVRSAIYNRQNRILTSSNDKTAKIWDARSGKCLLTLNGHFDYLNNAVYSPNGDHILTSSNDRTAKIWDAQTGLCISTLLGHFDQVNDACYSPNGNHIITCSNDRTAKVWDITGQCLLTLYGHLHDVTCVACSPKGDKILTGSKDKTVKIWDAKTGQCITTYEYTKRINSVAYSPREDGILIGLDDSAAVNLKFGSVTESMTHSNKVVSVTYNQSGSRILTGSEDKTAKIWKNSTGSWLLTLPEVSGLNIQGCDFRNLHPESKLSSGSILLLWQYGGIFQDEDAQNWAVLMEKHFGIKAPSNSYLH